MEKPSGLTGLWSVGRAQWRSFALAWAFPILVYLSFVAESFHGPMRSGDMLWIDFGSLVLLVLAGVLSSVPYRRRKATMGQSVFWALLVPIVVFVLLALLPFRFPITITDIPTGPNRWMKP